MRIRVAGIIPMQNGFAMMHRRNVQDHPLGEYYVFAGGGLEDGETLQEGTKREIEEEIGIQVKVGELLYQYTSQENQEIKEYYFLCEYVGGKFGSGTGPEFSHHPKYKHKGEYLPEIIAKQEISNLLIVPPETKEKFVKDIKAGRYDKYLEK
ncbi:MAG: NUDIX domain-containing protein [Clostridia bacterium]